MCVFSPKHVHILYNWALCVHALVTSSAILSMFQNSVGIAALPFTRLLIAIGCEATIGQRCHRMSVRSLIWFSLLARNRWPVLISLPQWGWVGAVGWCYDEWDMQTEPTASCTGPGSSAGSCSIMDFLINHPAGLKANCEAVQILYQCQHHKTDTVYEIDIGSYHLLQNPPYYTHPPYYLLIN